MSDKGDSFLYRAAESRVMSKVDTSNHGMDRHRGSGNGEALNGGVGVRKPKTPTLLDKSDEQGLVRPN